MSPKDENVFLFVPNLIGYARIIGTIVSCYYMPTDPMLAAALYIVSSLLDAVDGYAARLLNQSSSFGSVLDMVTDRCGTVVLMACLCHLYPQHLFALQMLIALDIGSHWVHMHNSLASGKGSHKSIELGENPLLRHYYHNRIVLFVLCSANEWVFASMYLKHFFDGPQITLAEHTMGLWHWVFYVSLPLSAIKQLISVVQLIAACVNITRQDVVTRKQQRAAKSS